MVLCWFDHTGQCTCTYVLLKLNSFSVIYPYYRPVPIPTTALSKACVCSSSFAGIVGSNPTGAWMSVSCECCLFSGRGLCVGPNPRPEECYQVWCVWVLSWSMDNGGDLAHCGVDV